MKEQQMLIELSTIVQSKNVPNMPVDAYDSFPPHWRTIRLREVLRERDIRAGELKVIESDNCPVLSLTKNHGLIPQSKRFINRVATNDISNYKVIGKGQIVYNPFVIWEGAIHTLKEIERGLISPAYLVWDAIEADAYFLDFLLRTPQLLKEFSRVASGIVQRRRTVHKDVFLNIKIHLPPLSEQHAITHILQTVKQVIQARRKELELELERKDALMQYLFTHGTQNETTKQSEVGEIPENWEVRRLGEVLRRSQYGLSVAGSLTGKYCILRMNSLVNGAVIFNDLQYVDIDKKTFEAFKLERNDILFNRTNSVELVGKTALFDKEDPAVFASYLIRITTDEEQVNPAFLNWYFNWEAIQKRLRFLASRGVSQANISASKLQTFQLPIPPLEEQKKIVSIFNAYAGKVVAIEKEITLHEELFRLLLDELMAGHISTAPLVEQLEKGL